MTNGGGQRGERRGVDQSTHLFGNGDGSQRDGGDEVDAAREDLDADVDRVGEEGEEIGLEGGGVEGGDVGVEDKLDWKKREVRGAWVGGRAGRRARRWG